MNPAYKTTLFSWLGSCLMALNILISSPVLAPGADDDIEDIKWVVMTEVGLLHPNKMVEVYQQLKNIGVDGIIEGIVWSSAETSSGVFNFTRARQSMQACQTVGIKWIPQIALHYPPSWLLNSDSKFRWLRKNGSYSSFDGSNPPNIFHPQTLFYVDRFINAFFDAFAQDSISLIYISTGPQGETYMPDNDSNFAAFDTNTIAAWRSFTGKSNAMPYSGYNKNDGSGASYSVFIDWWYNKMYAYMDHIYGLAKSRKPTSSFALKIGHYPAIGAIIEEQVQAVLQHNLKVISFGGPLSQATDANSLVVQIAHQYNMYGWVESFLRTFNNINQTPEWTKTKIIQYGLDGYMYQGFLDLFTDEFSGYQPESEFYLYRDLIASLSSKVVRAAADNSFTLYVNGQQKCSSSSWNIAANCYVDIVEGDVIAVDAVDNSGVGAFILESANQDENVVSDSTWKVSKTLQSGWQNAGFDDSGWENAMPQGNYGISPWFKNVNGFDSNSKAEWIWSSDAVNDNHIYLRKRIIHPNAIIKVSADNAFKVYLNGDMIGQGNNWQNMQEIGAVVEDGDVLMIQGLDTGGIGSVLAEVKLYDESNHLVKTISSNGTWRSSLDSGVLQASESPNFDPSEYPFASTYGNHGASPWGNVSGFEGSKASWTWTSNQSSDDTVYLFKRLVFGEDNDIEASIRVTADNQYNLWVNGNLIGSGTDWSKPKTYFVGIDKSAENVVAVEGIDAGGIAGALIEVTADGVVFSSDQNWKVSTQNQTDWNKITFDDSNWSNATAYGYYGVSPWLTTASGFSNVAQWIWSSDRNADDRVYLRRKIYFDPDQAIAAIRVTADNQYELYVNDQMTGSGNDWTKPRTFYVPFDKDAANLVAVKGIDAAGIAAALVEVSVNGAVIASDENWKVSNQLSTDWNQRSFDDGSWASATSYGYYGTSPWYSTATGFSSVARWIWSNNNSADDVVYLRRTIQLNSTDKVAKIRVTADNKFDLYVNGQFLGSGDDWTKPKLFYVHLPVGTTNVIAVEGTDTAGIAAALIDVEIDGVVYPSNTSWKVSKQFVTDWYKNSFNDSSWSNASVVAAYGASPWYTTATGFSSGCSWIWSNNSSADNKVYLRKKITL